MSKYAATTSVSSEASRSEIERTLTRYGASGFAYGWQNENAVVMFEMQNRRIKFVLPLPDKTSREFTHTEHRHNKRHPDDALKSWEQACRQKWRALALVIKAKLEAVESQVSMFEDEFLANIVLPNGSTVGGWLQPQIENAYKNKKMPPLLGYSPQ